MSRKWNRNIKKWNKTKAQLMVVVMNSNDTNEFANEYDLSIYVWCELMKISNSWLLRKMKLAQGGYQPALAFVQVLSNVVYNNIQL